MLLTCHVADGEHFVWLRDAFYERFGGDGKEGAMTKYLILA
jgi:hypothetical protein